MATVSPLQKNSRFQGPLRVPGRDEPDRVLEFLNTICDHDTPGRRQFEAELVESKAFVEGHQWLTYKGVRSRTQAREFFDMDEEAEGIPTPVTNEIFPMVDIERSRLGKRRSQPYVRPRRGNDTSAKQPAQIADDILDTTMDEVKWPGIYRQWVTDVSMFGTGGLSLGHEPDFRERTRIPLLTAQKCQSCHVTMADPSVPEKDARLIAMGAPDKIARLRQTGKTQGGLYKVSYEADGMCFNCGGPLQPWQLTDGDAAGKDIFNRPLGTDAPYCEIKLRNRSPWELFVENEGIGRTPGPLGEAGHPAWIAEDYPESLEMIEAMYEKGGEVRPDSQAELAKMFPMLGLYSSSTGGFQGITDRTVFNNHGRLTVFTGCRTRQDPLGRLIARSGRTLLLDTDLYVRSKDNPKKLVPRRSHHVWRFFPKANEYFGFSMVQALTSPQRRINMTFSQIVMNRETNGNDSWLLTPGMRLTDPGSIANLPGTHQVWHPDPRWPKAVPIQNPGRLFHPDGWKEIEFTIQRMQYIAGVMDVDRGNNPTGVTAGTAIEMLANKSSERRDMREQEGVEACREIWRDTLKMIREFQDGEERPYSSKVAGGDAIVEKKYRGADLKDQLDVVVDEEPSYDVKSFNREQLAMGYNMGLISNATAYERRELRKDMGISSSVPEGEDVQVADAERKFHLFASTLEKALDGPPTMGAPPADVEIPVIDENEDAHDTHFQIYGMQWKSEVGLRLKKEAGWEKALPILDGWRKDFDAQDAQRMQWEQLVVSGALDQANRTVAASNAAVQQELDAGAAPRDIAAAGMMAPPGMPQMVEQFRGYQPPPESVALHIEQIWLERLASAPDSVRFFVSAADMSTGPTVLDAPPVMPPGTTAPVGPPLPGMVPPSQMGMPAPPMMPPAPPPELREPFRSVFRMKAVTEAHNIYDERRKQRMAGGVPVTAAPGAPAAAPGAAPAAPAPAM